jgi:hypothetical protein
VVDIQRSNHVVASSEVAWVVQETSPVLEIVDHRTDHNLGMEDSEEMLEVMGIPSLDLEILNLTSSVQQ